MTPEQARRDALEVQARIKAQDEPTYEELVEAVSLAVEKLRSLNQGGSVEGVRLLAILARIPD